MTFIVSFLLAEKDLGMMICDSRGASCLYRLATSCLSEHALSNKLRVKIKNILIFFFNVKATFYFWSYAFIKFLTTDTF